MISFLYKAMLLACVLVHSSYAQQIFEATFNGGRRNGFSPDTGRTSDSVDLDFSDESGGIALITFNDSNDSSGFFRRRFRLQTGGDYIVRVSYRIFLGDGDGDGGTTSAVLIANQAETELQTITGSNRAIVQAISVPARFRAGGNTLRIGGTSSSSGSSVEFVSVAVSRAPEPRPTPPPVQPPPPVFSSNFSNGASGFQFVVDPLFDNTTPPGPGQNSREDNALVITLNGLNNNQGLVSGRYTRQVNIPEDGNYGLEVEYTGTGTNTFLGDSASVFVQVGSLISTVRQLDGQGNSGSVQISIVGNGNSPVGTNFLPAGRADIAVGAVLNSERVDAQFRLVITSVRVVEVL